MLHFSGTEPLEDLEMMVESASESMQSMSIGAGRQGPLASATAANHLAFERRKSREINATHHNIFGNFHIVASSDIPPDPDDSRFSYFSIDHVLTYVGFCEDFGPFSLGTVHTFCNIMDDVMKQNAGHPIALLIFPDCKDITNAVFLVGSFMVMRLSMPQEEVRYRMQSLQASMVSYRDVSPGKQNFDLYVEDCWSGLCKAKALGWVDFGANGFDPDEYSHYDSPLNADMHEILPGKFIAMRGPKDLPGGRLWQDVLTPEGDFSHRDFSPQHYIEILHQFNVQAVVRLNTPEYLVQTFAEGGVAVADLFFEDCTDPPAEVVGKFMMLAEGLPGALAVHCKAGLGRTGTLIGLYMMKHHGFTAREAMGWLRIVRPGSVIGTQQQFLCSKEALMHKAGDKFRRDGPKRVADGQSFEAVQRFVRQVDEYVEVRLTAFLAAGAAGAVPEAPAAPRAGAGAAARGHRMRRGQSTEEETLAAHVSAAADRRNGVRAAQPLAVADSGEAASSSWGPTPH